MAIVPKECEVSKRKSKAMFLVGIYILYGNLKFVYFLCEKGHQGASKPRC